MAKKSTVLGRLYDGDFTARMTGIDTNTPTREGVYLISLSDNAAAYIPRFVSIELLNEQRDQWQAHLNATGEKLENPVGDIRSRQIGWELLEMTKLAMFIEYSEFETCPTVEQSTFGIAHIRGLDCAETFASDDPTPCLILHIRTLTGATGATGAKGDKEDK